MDFQSAEVYSKLMTTFSKKEAIKFGWGVMKKHFWFFVGIFITAIIIQAIPEVFSSLKETNKEAWVGILFIVVSLLFIVVKIVIDLGFIKIALQLHDNQPVSFTTLFSQRGSQAGNYFLASIVYNLAIFGGVILLIVPAFIFAIRFQYYSYLIVDKGLGPIEALRQSWRMTKGNTWNLLLLSILLGLINLGGVLLLVVGLLATLPTSMMANAYVFRKLQTANTPPSPAPAV